MKISFPKFENNIWQLLELDLLNYREDSNDYILRSSKELHDFCSKYGISISSLNSINKEKTTIIKNSKKCNDCALILPISNFYKTIVVLMCMLQYAKVVK